MSNKLARLLVDLIYHSFKTELDEQNYHDIVECLRKLKNILTINDLKPHYTQYNFPDTYDPFLVMERLRFAYFFGKHSTELDDILTNISIEYDAINENNTVIGN